MGGVKFTPSTLEDAAEWTIHRAKQKYGRAVSIRLSNAYCVALASEDPKYRDLLNGAGVTFPDGAPVALLMRAKLAPMGFRSGRVRGPSFFRSVIESPSSDGVRHFFLGSSELVLNRITNRFAEEIPWAKIAGAFSPPFEPINDGFLEQCLDAVKHATADIIWVGLGTPKQDFVVQFLAERTDAIVVGVGAGLDFYARTVPEAPLLFQNTGTEWLFRLLSEPRRLWKRYFFGNLQFIRALFKHSIRVELNEDGSTKEVTG